VPHIRLAHRRRTKRAIVAIAHSFFVIAYQVLKDGTGFDDLGTDCVDRGDPGHIKRPPIGVAALRLQAADLFPLTA